MNNITYITQSKTNLLKHAYIREMAATALELLNVDPSRRNISLLMGYPVTMTNQKAVEAWIAEFLLEYAPIVDFNEVVVPALHSHLSSLRLDMMLALPSDYN